ncbi:hypothetical protein CMI37_24730 [Candidatus Pacearchaeota archaeon]|nr:hypothetical protein [Candidatus Pacearchaeota archaeon]
MNELENFKEETAFRLFGRSRNLAIAGNQCVKCGAHNLEFRDELSRKEHGISGFCQSCQDDVFGPSDEDKEEVLGIAHEILGEEE